MNIKLANPKSNKKIDNEVLKTLKSGCYVKGPKLKGFEDNFSEYCDTKFGVGVNSGTVAIYLGLEGLGLKKGDKVIVPSHTFVGSASPLLKLGIEPIFIDVDNYYTINPSLLNEINMDNVKGIISVDLYGQMSDYSKLNKFCKKNNLYLIEDSAQAHGAELNGKKAGSFGDVGCFSFFPTKNLSVLGEGGMVVTNNRKYFDFIMALRDQGRNYSKKNGKFISEYPAMNFRLSELHATIGNCNLNNLDSENNKRIKLAQIYNAELKDFVDTPIVRNNSKHVFHQYVIRVPKKIRKELQLFLSKNGISTGIHYPIPLHKQPIFKNFKSTDLSETNLLIDEILSLPMYPDLPLNQVNFVVKKIKEFFK
jgi:dTDP-4-amino-4,6-dideoxygalactose transaminase